MELLSQVGNLATMIVAFVVVISVVVSVHEYGHYIVARWVGIHAEVFSLGMGKVLFSRVDKRGTVWQVAALPIGGYVKFLGDKDASSATDEDAMAEMNDYDRRRSFPAAAVWRRALAVVAGPVFNFILSIAVFSGLIMWQGVAVSEPTIGELVELPYDTGLQVGDQIVAIEGLDVANYSDFYTALATVETPRDIAMQVRRDGRIQDITVAYMYAPLVGSVTPLSPASNAGLQTGDLILSADGISVSTFAELPEIIIAAEGREIELTVWRAGQTLNLTMIPEMSLLEDGEGGFIERVVIGVHSTLYFVPASYTPSPFEAVEFGARRTYSVITNSVNSLKHIILGNVSAKNLQGPIGIARVSGEMIKIDTFSFISWIAIISSAIGFLNLLPIPVLDGGHLAAFAYESVRGQPPNPKFMQVFMTIGLVLVLSLMVFVTYNDILRI